MNKIQFKRTSWIPLLVTLTGFAAQAQESRAPVKSASQAKHKYVPVSFEYQLGDRTLRVAGYSRDFQDESKNTWSPKFECRSERSQDRTDFTIYELKYANGQVGTVLSGSVLGSNRNLTLSSPVSNPKWWIGDGLLEIDLNREIRKAPTLFMGAFVSLNGVLLSNEEYSYVQDAEEGHGPDRPASFTTARHVRYSWVCTTAVPFLNPKPTRKKPSAKKPPAHKPKPHPAPTKLPDFSKISPSEWERVREEAGEIGSKRLPLPRDPLKILPKSDPLGDREAQRLLAERARWLRNLELDQASEGPSDQDQLMAFWQQAGLSESASIPDAFSLLSDGFQPLPIADREDRFACVGEALSNLISLQLSHEFRRTDVRSDTNQIGHTCVSIYSLLLDGQLSKPASSEQARTQITAEKEALEKASSNSITSKVNPYRTAEPFSGVQAMAAYKIPFSVVLGGEDKREYRIHGYAQFPSMSSRNTGSIRNLFEVDIGEEGTILDGSLVKKRDFARVFESYSLQLRFKQPEKIVLTLKHALAEQRFPILAALKTDAYETNPTTNVLSGFQEDSVGHAITLVGYDSQYFYAFDSWSDKKTHRYEGGNRVYAITPRDLLYALIGFEVVTRIAP